MKESTQHTARLHELDGVTHAVLEGLGVGVLAANPRDGVLVYNAEAERLLGVDQESLGRALESGALVVGSAGGREALLGVLAGEVVGRIEVALTPPGVGVRRWIELDSKPWGRGSLTTLRDVTKAHDERAALEERSRRYERMFAEAPEALALVCRVSGHIIEINETAAELFGASSREYIGEHIQVLGLDACMVGELAQKARARQDHAFPEPVACSVTRAGEERALLAFASSMTDDVESPLCVGFHDVTDHEHALSRMQSYHEQFLRAQALTQVGSWEVDQRDGSLVWSDQLFRLHGLEPGGQPSVERWVERVHEVDRERVEAALAEALVSPRDFELHYRVEVDGELHTIETIGKVRGEGTAQRFYGTSQDVTERMRSVDELKAYAEQLEMANQDLQDFACVASHDLQEPLRKVMAFSDRLRSRYSDQLDDRAHDYLERVQNSAERMKTLIEDLLELSRVATNTTRLERFDAREMIDDLVDMFEVRLESTRGRVEVEVEGQIEGDPVQLRQLLQNLISNGLKFHAPGTPPVVRVYGRVVEDESTSLLDADPVRLYELVVEDDGIGMPQEMCGCIFEPFKRLHGRSSKYDGSGIGLAICRKIVERHGGEIRVDSAEGMGTRFTIHVPLDTYSL
jgi:PAS domain S-box-containing protein